MCTRALSCLNYSIGFPTVIILVNRHISLGSPQNMARKAHFHSQVYSPACLLVRWPYGLTYEWNRSFGNCSRHDLVWAWVSKENFVEYFLENVSQCESTNNKFHLFCKGLNQSLLVGNLSDYVWRKIRFPYECAQLYSSTTALLPCFGIVNAFLWLCERMANNSSRGV